MGRGSTGLTRAAQGILFAVFVVCVYRAATAPVSTGEAVAYDHFVRPPLREVVLAPDGYSGIIFGILAKRTVGLMRLSELSLRMPSLLGCALYLWAAYPLWRRWLHNWRALSGLLTLGALPVIVEGFWRAGGRGIALGLILLSIALLVGYLQFDPPLKTRNLNLAGFCLGLSAVADLRMGILAAALAIGFVPLAARYKKMPCNVPVERVVITGVVTAFLILILPLSRAESVGPPARPPSSSDLSVRSLIRILRARTGDLPLRVGVSREFEPIVLFYKASYRRRAWQIVDISTAAGKLDYYLLSAEEASARHREVIAQEPGAALAQ
jgi:hypothetical protein